MSTGRRSIHVAGLDHGALPIPAASRIGPLIATGGVRGVDRKTGTIPSDVGAQARLMFENLVAIIEAAGGTPQDIVKVTVYVDVPEARAAVNTEWLKWFPDAGSRPARHTLNYELGGGMLVQCDALAFVAGAAS
jgi:2-iminobutanoate/2-iminopropanoate deaminase